MRLSLMSVVTPVLFFLSALAFAENPVGVIPSYQEALRASQQERARAGGPTVSAQDRLAMEASARDLATATPAPGLDVGDQASDFTLTNAFGRTVRLRDLLADGTVVLTCDRGGVLRAAHADVDYPQRREPAAIVAALEAVETE